MTMQIFQKPLIIVIGFFFALSLCMKSKSSLFHFIFILLIFVPIFGQTAEVDACAPVGREFNKVKEAQHNSNGPIELGLYESAQSQMDKCVASRFSSCYPSLKQEIEWSKLVEIFNGSIQDKSGRMNYPGADCYARAYVLARRLALAGYYSQQIWIQESPSLVAINLSLEGKPSTFGSNGRDLVMYNDYEGGHAVVSIKTRMVDGVVRRVILDPQFFSRPMSLEEYFVTTMGQVCTNRTGEPIGERPPWSCNFVYRNAFETLESGGWMNSDRTEVKIEQCGWNNLQKYLGDISRSNQANPPPIPFTSDIDVNAFRREMILQGFHKKKLALQDRLTDLRSIDAGVDEEQQTISEALKAYPAVMERIRKNLSVIGRPKNQRTAK